MAGTIKGISVSIGGDTVDLKKSLKALEILCGKFC